MKSVQKSVFSTVIVIALVTILLIPTSPTHIAKGYSCSSSASGVSTSSTSVTGATGSCSTSSSSNHKVTSGHASCTLSSPNCSLRTGIGSGSASTGGGTGGSCSRSFATQSGAFASSQSMMVKCAR